jgi:hypothetical protein
MLRSTIRSLLAWLAARSLRKYNTKLILVYGWDWTEVVREGLYNLLSDNVNVRRNTGWIKWDLGLPLFVLGYDYSPNLTKWQLLRIVVLAALKLLRPRRFSQYLVVSAYAKSPQTLDYWLALGEVELLVVLPERQGQRPLLGTDGLVAANVHQSLDLTHLSMPIAQIQASRKQVALFGTGTSELQSHLLGLLAKINLEYLQKQGFKFKDSDLESAVLKIDWQGYVLSRIRANLLAPES